MEGDTGAGRAMRMSSKLGQSGLLITGVHSDGKCFWDVLFREELTQRRGDAESQRWTRIPFADVCGALPRRRYDTYYSSRMVFYLHFYWVFYSKKRFPR